MVRNFDVEVNINDVPFDRICNVIVRHVWLFEISINTFLVSFRCWNS